MQRQVKCLHGLQESLPVGNRFVKAGSGASDVKIHQFGISRHGHRPFSISLRLAIIQRCRGKVKKIGHHLGHLAVNFANASRKGETHRPGCGIPLDWDINGGGNANETHEQRDGLHHGAALD